MDVPSVVSCLDLALPAVRGIKLNGDADVDVGRRRRWRRALASGACGNVIAAKSLRLQCLNIIPILPHFLLLTPASTVFADVIFRTIIRGTSCVPYAERVAFALVPHQSIHAFRPILHFCQAKLVYTRYSNMTATAILV